MAERRDPTTTEELQDQAVETEEHVHDHDHDHDHDDESEASKKKNLQAKLKEAIEVAVEDVGPLRKKVTITIPRAAIDEQLGEQYEELRNEAVVPGFRRGRAPQKLLEKRFGADVGEQVGSSLVGNGYYAAMEKVDLKAIGEPLVQVKYTEDRKSEGGKEAPAEVEKLLPVDEALKHLKLPKEGDLKFALEVEIKPTFELPKLEGIPVGKTKVAITDEDVEKEIRRIMAMRATYRPVEGGKVEPDDLLVGKYSLTVDGQVVHSEENAELAARDQRYDQVPITGFGEAARGKKAGDAVSVAVTLPDDFNEVPLRGKSGTVTLEIADIKRLDIPPLDDEFIKRMGWETQEEFRLFLRERMERQATEEVRQRQLEQIADYLVSKADFDVPEGVSQRQAERIVARRMLELFRHGVPDAEISKRVDEMRVTAAAQARKDLKRAFIIDAIAEKEEITIQEDELNEAIAQIAARREQRFDRVRDEILRTNNLSTLYSAIQEKKVLESLLEKADLKESDE